MGGCSIKGAPGSRVLRPKCPYLARFLKSSAAAWPTEAKPAIGLQEGRPSDKSCMQRPVLEHPGNDQSTTHLSSTAMIQLLSTTPHPATSHPTPPSSFHWLLCLKMTIQRTNLACRCSALHAPFQPRKRPKHHPTMLESHDSTPECHPTSNHFTPNATLKFSLASMPQNDHPTDKSYLSLLRAPCPLSTTKTTKTPPNHA